MSKIETSTIIKILERVGAEGTSLKDIHATLVDTYGEEDAIKMPTLHERLQRLVSSGELVKDPATKKYIVAGRVRDGDELLIKHVPFFKACVEHSVSLYMETKEAVQPISPIGEDFQPLLDQFQADFKDLVKKDFISRYKNGHVWLSLNAFEQLGHVCPVCFNPIDPVRPFLVCDLQDTKLKTPYLIKVHLQCQDDLFIRQEDVPKSLIKNRSRQVQKEEDDSERSLPEYYMQETCPICGLPLDCFRLKTSFSKDARIIAEIFKELYGDVKSMYWGRLVDFDRYLYTMSKVVMKDGVLFHPNCVPDGAGAIGSQVGC